MAMSRRVFLLAALLPAAPAWPQTINEARVKAKLALTLARYTQWPAAALGAPGDPLQLCVLHRSESLTAAFAELAGQTVNGHPVRVLNAPPAAGLACHVLFVQDVAERGAAAAMLSAATAPVLTIGDSDGFAARGGMVELVNVNDAIRLDVNLKVLRAAQLELSSRVLQLARQVRE